MKTARADKTVQRDRWVRKNKQSAACIMYHENLEKVSLL